MNNCKYRKQLGHIMITLSLGLLASLFVFIGVSVEAWAASNNPPVWDLRLLNKPPKMKWLVHEGPVHSLEYQSLPYKGKQTSVFAYYASPATLSGYTVSVKKKFPGIILLHSGKGHAVPVWARSWAQLGYAALSMDLSGCGSDQKPLPNAVPADDLLTYDWNYHAVANVILAHSLLLSFKEVDPTRTAVTGVSVGGQLTCIVANLDKRFKAAVPVYGCGYLHENSLFSQELSRMGKAQRDRWVKTFDPSSYIGSITIPLMFITGADDPFYPLDSYVKSYKLAKGSRNLCIVPGLPHRIDVGGTIAEPYLFIDQICRNGIPLPYIYHPKIVNGQVKAKFKSNTKPILATLYYTTDTCASKDRKWNALDALITGSFITCEEPPENTTAWLLTLSDERQAMVSSEVIFQR